LRQYFHRPKTKIINQTMAAALTLLVELMETFNKPLKSVPGLTAVHRTPLSGRRLAQR